ncbi:MAG: DUF2335 domain-containing protein [Alphaproteobacteria bacterium]|nr:DUF2335 domain-containing protein [Alphaproteobacteria bacterium]
MLLASGLVAQQTNVWQRQFPPPEAVERYERVLPGSFDRRMRMAEDLQAARIAEVRRADAFLQADTRRGHWLGFAVSALATAGAIVCVVLPQPAVAVAFLAVPFTGLARALLAGARAGRSGPPDRPQS